MLNILFLQAQASRPDVAVRREFRWRELSQCRFLPGRVRERRAGRCLLNRR